MKTLTLYEAYTNARNRKELVGQRLRWDPGNERLQIRLARLTRQHQKLDRRIRAVLSDFPYLSRNCCVICGWTATACDCVEFRPPANYVSTADLIARSKAAREGVKCKS